MKKFFKNTIIFFIYALPTLIFLNLIIEIKYKFIRSPSLIYEKLQKIGYIDTKENPYKKFTVQHIHPQYMFGLPIFSEKRSEISNRFVSLDQNGYRNTIRNFSLKSEKLFEKCILILGGSTAFGHGVSNDSNTFSSIIQSKLDNNYLVFNLGTPSWNSRQELISLINFKSRPISRRCKSIDTISITGANDIYVTQEYLSGSLIANELDSTEFISAPESFTHLLEKVDDIRSENDPIYNLKRLLKSIFNTFFGKLYAFSKYRLFLILNNQNAQNDYLNEKVSSYSLEDKKFINKQMNAFWKNQIFISKLLSSDKKESRQNNHLVVLQPNTKNVEQDTIWAYANKKMDEQKNKQNFPDNFDVLDLRKFSLEEKIKYETLIDLLTNQKITYSKEYLLNKNFFDNVHLSDIGVKRVSDFIFKKYITKKTNTIKRKI